TPAWLAPATTSATSATSNGWHQTTCICRSGKSGNWSAPVTRRPCGSDHVLYWSQQEKKRSDLPRNRPLLTSSTRRKRTGASTPTKGYLDGETHLYVGRKLCGLRLRLGCRGLEYRLYGGERRFSNADRRLSRVSRLGDGLELGAGRLLYALQ